MPTSVAPDPIAILRMAPETVMYICLSSWVLGLAFLSKLRTANLPFLLWLTHLVLTPCLFPHVLFLLPAPFLTDFPAPPPPRAEFYVCPPRPCARESPDLVCHPPHANPGTDMFNPSWYPLGVEVLIHNPPSQENCCKCENNLLDPCTASSRPASVIM